MPHSLLFKNKIPFFIEHIIIYKMLLIYLIIVWHIHALPEHQYNMYNTDQHQDGFCLFYYAANLVVEYFLMDGISMHLVDNRVKKPTNIEYI